MDVNPYGAANSRGGGGLCCESPVTEKALWEGHTHACPAEIFVSLHIRASRVLCFLRVWRVSFAHPQPLKRVCRAYQPAAGDLVQNSDSRHALLLLLELRC